MYSVVKEVEVFFSSDFSMHRTIRSNADGGGFGHTIRELGRVCWGCVYFSATVLHRQ